MKASSLSRLMPLLQRACNVNNKRLIIGLFTVALALCMATPASAQSNYPIQVDSGWNLLSLPASVSNGSKESLFPSAASAAFTFHDPIGYEEQDTLQSGVGFWLKFNASDTVQITGERIFEDTVAVQAGWNLIGSLSFPIAADSIKAEPSGIIISQFFGYVPGGAYQQADTLYPGLGYWVKVNQQGSVVLSSSGGWPCPDIPTVFYEGKTYTTVQIGTQCWLRENLEVGAMINGAGAQTNNGIIEKYCYGDDPANCNINGGLYQWQEAMKYRNTTQHVRGICPPRWHIPTLAELHTLSAAVGGDGNALKATGQGTGQGAGTNTSGFSALLAGYREFSGSFSDLGSNVVVWSSVQFDTSTAFGLVLSGLNAAVMLDGADQQYGFSVRCLEGDAPNLPPLIPSNPSPPNGSTGQLPSLTLSWSCSDPDGDSLTYDVYMAATNPPLTVVSTGQSDTTLPRTGLIAGMTYYWKVVAKAGTRDSTSSPVWSFTVAAMGFPCPGIPTVNYAGKIYNTVQIGRQCWLKENIDVGTMIQGLQDQHDNSIIEKYCYNNDTFYCNTYGGLYQWWEAIQYDTSEAAQGICPPGWRLPANADVYALRNTVAGNGNALKAVGEGSGGGAGTNTSGFSALLAGFRNPLGFENLTDITYLWTTSRYSASAAYFLTMWRYDSNVWLWWGADSNYDGSSVRCLRPNAPPDAPSCQSPDSGATNVPLSVMLNWSCSDPDGDPLTYDVYFGTTNPPDTMVSSNRPETTMERRGLVGGTTYYWRVVAKDHRDNTLGPVWSFRTAATDLPCPGVPKVTYDGKVYHTVKIGSQCWLRENLDVGAMMPGSQDQTDDGAIEKYCYNNDPANCDTSGALYQWQEAMQYDTAQGGQGICPPGWHMPTLAEFQALDTIVGGDGNALKAIGQGAGGGVGTNTSGFSALLAGRRSTTGSFDYVGSFAYFWSSTQYDAAKAHDFFLHSGSSYVLLQPQSVSYGFSVRCLMD